MKSIDIFTRKHLGLLFLVSCILSCTFTQTAPEPEEEVVEYAKLTPPDFRKRLADAPIAYLPLGTLEWHGEHLPLGSDGLQSFEFMKVLAREAGGIVLPMLHLGPDTMLMVEGKELYGCDHWLSRPGSREYFPAQQLDGSAYWIPDDVFGSILENSIKQLVRAGFRIIVAHGHGPSNLHVIKHWREWEERYDVMIYTCWAWNVRGEYDKESDERAREGLGIMIDHAARNETSLMMYFYPELVQLENLPSDTAIWPKGVSGHDPRTTASPELGQEAVEYHVDRMKKILAEALETINPG